MQHEIFSPSCKISSHAVPWNTSPTSVSTHAFSSVPFEPPSTTPSALTIKSLSIANRLNICLLFSKKPFLSTTSPNANDSCKRFSDAYFLSALPLESRISLGSLRHLVDGVVTRSKSNKGLGILHTHQQHFIKFLIEIKLPINPTLDQFKQNHRDHFLACYTTYLAMEPLILFRSIPADTIVKYLNDVAIFSIPLQNPTHDQYGNRV